MTHRVIRMQLDRLVKRLHRLVDPALIQQNVPQISMGVGKGGIQFNGAPAGSFGFGQLPGLPKGVTEIAEQFRRLGSKRARLAK